MFAANKPLKGNRRSDKRWLAVKPPAARRLRSVAASVSRDISSTGASKLHLLIMFFILIRLIYSLPSAEARRGESRAGAAGSCSSRPDRAEARVSGRHFAGSVRGGGARLHPVLVGAPEMCPRTFISIAGAGAEQGVLLGDAQGIQPR